MRSLFGIVGLLVVVAMVGVLAKKQLTSTQQQVPAAAVQVVNTTDRAAVGELITMTEYVDVIVPL